MELAGVSLAPLLFSETQYLRWYLGPKAIEAAAKFLDGRGYLVPDSFTGWRTKPSVSVKNWQIDGRGARSTSRRQDKRAVSSRILMLGDSMVNGGMRVKNNETISAFLENDRVEVLNFGTMAYSLDQSLIAYQRMLHKYDADLVIVGLDRGSIEGLKNHYLPFRIPDEKNMPYVKPRYELVNGSLRLTSVEPRRLLADVPKGSEFLRFLKEHDGYYNVFAQYSRFGFCPLTALGLRAYRRLHNIGRLLFSIDDSDELLLAIMNKMSEVTQEHGARLVFVILPTQVDCTRGSFHRFFPDEYSHLLNIVASRGYQVVDGRKVLITDGCPASSLFDDDATHYRPLANRLIASAIRNRIGQMSAD
jgi:hypothetical protein